MDDDTLKKLILAIEDSNKKAIQEANKSQLEEIKSHIAREITNIKDIITAETKKINELEASYLQLKEKNYILEKSLKKNNIIIFGLEHQENLPQYVIETINTLLQINITVSDIDDVFYIGKQNEKRPVIVKLVSYLNKQRILKNCKKLKGTNISIAEDLTVEDRKTHKILRQHLTKARLSNVNAHIRNNKLYVNGDQFTAEQLMENDEELVINNNSLEEEENIINNKSNSAPPTPTTERKEIAEQKQKKEEIYGKECETKIVDITKKRIISSKATAQQRPRSSSRLIGKDTKTNIEPSSSKTVSTPPTKKPC